jgi:hypothetical protein
MLWVRGIAVFSWVAAFGFCAHFCSKEGLYPMVWYLLLVLLLNLWAILKRTPGKALKTTAILSALIGFAAIVFYIENELYLNWFGVAYGYSNILDFSGGYRYFDAPDFFVSIGLLLLLTLNLVAIIRPKTPAFLKETKAKNPHILVAYGFATVLIILLIILITVIALK